MKKKVFRERYLAKVETFEEKIENPILEVKEEKKPTKRGKKNDNE